MFIYANGTMTDIGTLGWVNSTGTVINNKGQVAGSASIGQNKTHAFLYSKGKMSDLGTLGGDDSYAADKNEMGAVTGYSDTLGSAFDHAFTYKGKEMLDLGELAPGLGSFALAINASGVDCELTLAGDGPMRTELEERMERCELGRCVHVSGWISGAAVRQLILDSGALVLPSFAEGLPVVIMEAMALHRPVLTTYIAGIPELMRPGMNGWLFPAGCVEELTSAMRECLAMRPGELDKMGADAYDRVIARHDIDDEAGKLARLFYGARA